MLSNPDGAPSATLNRWIVSILTFHFELVHVAGTHPRPDGLSRRPRQPDDNTPDTDEAFRDWIDQLHGFVHQLNAVVPRSPPLPTLFPTFALSSDDIEQPSIMYEDIPQSDHAKQDDARLIRVRQWLSDLIRPSSMSNDEYSTFLRYCTEFFLDSGKLWRKDSHGAHKIVASPESRIDIIRAAHDDLGHKMVFATKALIALRF
jgi:hypothetical protein